MSTHTVPKQFKLSCTPVSDVKHFPGAIAEFCCWCCLSSLSSSSFCCHDVPSWALLLKTYLAHVQHLKCGMVSGVVFDGQLLAKNRHISPQCITIWAKISLLLFALDASSSPLNNLPRFCQTHSPVEVCFSQIAEISLFPRRRQPGFIKSLVCLAGNKFTLPWIKKAV